LQRDGYIKTAEALSGVLVCFEPLSVFPDPGSRSQVLCFTSEVHGCFSIKRAVSGGFIDPLGFGVPVYPRVEEEQDAEASGPQRRQRDMHSGPVGRER
jgi:hypothetical protein